MLSKLYLPKWCEVPIMLYNHQDRSIYYQQMLRRSNIASTHIRNTLKLLHQSNYIFISKGRKIKYIKLTMNGEKLAQKILGLKFFIEQNGHDQILQDREELYE